MGVVLLAGLVGGDLEVVGEEVALESGGAVQDTGYDCVVCGCGQVGG